MGEPRIMFLRGHLAPHVAKGLAYIDSVKRKPP